MIYQSTVSIMHSQNPCYGVLILHYDCCNARKSPRFSPKYKIVSMQKILFYPILSVVNWAKRNRPREERSDVSIRMHNTKTNTGHLFSETSTQNKRSKQALISRVVKIIRSNFELAALLEATQQRRKGGGGGDLRAARSEVTMVEPPSAVVTHIMKTNTVYKIRFHLMWRSLYSFL